MNVIHFLKSSIRQGTQISHFNINAGSLIGAIGHFGLYFVYKFIFHNRWENMPVRLVGVALCIGVLFRVRNPNFLGKYFVFYWHTMLIYMLPFIITLFTLKNNFDEPWLTWEVFMIFVLISFVPNFLMFLFDLGIGVAAAFIAFQFIPPFFALEPTFNIGHYSIVAVFSILAGFMISLSNLKGIIATENNTVLQILASSIAHEMRNPLAQVKFSFERILSEIPIKHSNSITEQISSESLGKVYLSVAQGKMAVARGAQIIDMILSETRNKIIDPNCFSYCSCFGITLKALDEYGYESDQDRQKMTLDCNDDFLIKVDETLYVFVLFNLIINAFYFMKPHPDARISIRLEKGGSHNRVYVRDTGPGIPAENLTLLFDAYFTSGKKGGTGLGLSYCKRVMRAFNGDITCNSVLGEYTEFILTFSIVKEKEIAEYRKKIIADHLDIFRDKRILVIDDKVADRKQVIHYLKPFKADIDEAGDGAEAIQMIKQNHYDALLMNLNMPVMNGFEATEAIRSGKAGILSIDIPIIGHTADPLYIARAKTEKVGMQGFITKPVQEFELIRSIAAIFNLKYFNSALAFSGMTVMLVDDANVIRLSLRWLLEKFNINVIEAVNGTEALKHLRDNSITCDLILMDIQMPGLDGLETTRQIRTDQSIRFKDIPIIGLSGESDETEISKAFDAGMNDYVVKPVDNQALIRKIGQWTKIESVNHVH